MVSTEATHLALILPPEEDAKCRLVNGRRRSDSERRRPLNGEDRAGGDNTQEGDTCKKEKLRYMYSFLNF